MQSGKMGQILRLSTELAGVNDLDVLLERVLTGARGFAHADAGTLYILEEDRLRFGCTQNDTLHGRLSPGDKLVYSSLTVPLSPTNIAGYTAISGEVLNIADAYSIPESAPYGFDSSYDRLSGYRTSSLLTVPLRTSRGRTVGVLQMINALDEAGKGTRFSAEDEVVISYFGNAAAMALERAQMTRALILRMISMAELRDPKETGPHVNRVAAFAVEIYERWARSHGVAADQISHDRDVLRLAAMLHDVGKVAIPDAILKKPGRLTPDEFAVMKCHTYLGARLFRDSGSYLDEAAAQVALRHHENWDGTGYPGHIDVDTGVPLPGFEDDAGNGVGLAGEEIPLFGRIVKVADVYDALCSKRVYKDAMPEAEALSIIDGDRGTAFDPEMVDALHGALDSIRAIAKYYATES